MHDNHAKFEETERNINIIKKSVVKVIILSFITVSIYYSIWFLNVRSFINKLNYSRKISFIIPIMSIILTAICIISAFVKGYIEVVNPNNIYVSYISIFSKYLLSILIIVYTFLEFKIRRILLEHYGTNLNISALATFFGGIFYLQYKINKL